jgi:hypothetical protein
MRCKASWELCISRIGIEEGSELINKAISRGFIGFKIQQTHRIPMSFFVFQKEGVPTFFILNFIFFFVPFIALLLTLLLLGLPQKPGSVKK